jgi:hypothetical protein
VVNKCFYRLFLFDGAQAAFEAFKIPRICSFVIRGMTQTTGFQLPSKETIKDMVRGWPMRLISIILHMCHQTPDTTYPYMAREFMLRIKLWMVLCSLAFVIGYPEFLTAAEKYYYYLHVSSFRSITNADKDAERLHRKGYDTVVSYERVADKGFWYRVYMGPFISLQEVKLKRSELRRKKLVDYAAIQKRKTLISRELPKKPEVPERKEEVERKEPAKEIPPPAPEVPTEVPAIRKKPVEEKKPEVPTLPERVIKPVKPPPEITIKPPKKEREFRWEGAGRNLPQGRISVGYRHSYRDIETELEKRKEITPTGITDVSLSSADREGFHTSFHMDGLRFSFGLARSLEVFVDASAAYKEFSDFDVAYGGGLRVNLFEVTRGALRGLYGAVQGEYMAGKLNYEYTSPDSSKWQKDADWKELSAKAELGLVRSRICGYGGVVYLNYQEDAERKLMPTSTSFAFQDELEQKGLGVYGGFDIRLSSTFFLNIEGQAISQESIIGAIEYHF